MPKSSFLIQHLHAIIEKRRFALTYVYCDYRDKDKQDTCSIIGDLAKQLLLQASPIPSDVWATFERHEAITTEKAKQIFTLLSRTFECTYVCIDALDELMHQPRFDLLRFLSTFRGDILRIFCTARISVESEVTNLLGPFGIKTLQIFAHEVDLRTHIKVKITRDRNRTAMDTRLQEDITKELISRSQGL